MLLLDCYIYDLAAPGHKRRAGEYLCHQEYGETLGITQDEQGSRVRIVGAGCYEADGELSFEIVVSGRESAPLLATYETRVLIGPGEEFFFVPIAQLRTDMPIAVPVEGGIVLSRIRSCRQTRVTRYWDAEPTALKLLLSRRGAFACISGICRL